MYVHLCNKNGVMVLFVWGCGGVSTYLSPLTTNNLYFFIWALYMHTHKLFVVENKRVFPVLFSFKMWTHTCLHAQWDQAIVSVGAENEHTYMFCTCTPQEVVCLCLCFVFAIE
eukprot:NODE_599_length_790_cov_182.630229_g535_i0.p1 GENE.NODE_599_length_790_cov_182.630229_g535_i0~~NODE_599_length_790_cov_182.630229_g535_i0.p1  ORF type:complete len:113 (-),score=14.47 NODE_599_length_790_cov_182.630229_g535_i0:158-496(-)